MHLPKVIYFLHSQRIVNSLLLPSLLLLLLLPLSSVCKSNCKNQAATKQLASSFYWWQKSSHAMRKTRSTHPLYLLCMRVRSCAYQTEKMRIMPTEMQITYTISTIRRTATTTNEKKTNCDTTTQGNIHQTTHLPLSLYLTHWITLFPKTRMQEEKNTKLKKKHAHLVVIYRWASFYSIFILLSNATTHYIRATKIQIG